MSVRKAQMLLMQAAARGFCFDPKDPPSRSAEDDKSGKKKGEKDDKGGKKEETVSGGAGGNDETKVTLSETELRRREEAAAQRVRDDLAAERRREEEKAEREKAEKDGDNKRLLDLERSKREEKERELDQVKLDNKKLKVKDDLRNYIGEKHAAYAGCANWIFNGLEFDLKTSDADIEAQIKKVVEKYVADNPRTGGGGGSAAPGGPGVTVPKGSKVGAAGQKGAGGDLAQGYINRHYNVGPKGETAANGSAK
jgi:hypothetical protein